MFRVRIKSENIWRRASETPILKKLVRADMQSISNMKSPETIDLAFSEIDLLSGVSKQTNTQRFAEVDHMSVQLITSRSLMKIHDVGVSSGITSLELRRQLDAAGFEGEMFISDKFARFWVHRRGASTDIFDSDQNIVCSYFGPLVGDSEDTWKLPISRLIYRRALKRGFDEKNEESFLLLHPDVLDAIEKSDIGFIDFDVFENQSERLFDYIRCMNLLNLGYFSTEKIMNGLRTLHTCLLQDGILQVGRTHLEGGNHVSFYERTSDGFAPVKTIGKGSEIAHLVTEFRV
jgi:hypothetical protein